MRLVKYRDAGMHTYTYFYVNSENRTLSPFFDSETDAKKWLDEQLNNFDNWKANKQFV